VALALAVALWMAGAGCMLGCENMAGAAAASDHHASADTAVIVASGEACASMHSHDCCAKSASKSSKSQTNKNHATPSARTDYAIASESIATSSAMMNCPLAVNAMAALPKSSPDQSSTALLSAGARPAVSNSFEQTISFSRPLRLPNRGHTYLHCCTFLI
jgi:NAD/NADP transhydrogenase alpha subunit